jgi:hypothetical protein
MALQSIPCRNDVPWYLFRITLSNVVYTLRFRFDGRMGRWMMDMADPNNNDIIVGVPLLIGINLLGRFVNPALPPGFFFVVANNNDQSQPTRYSFGETHTLVYDDET